MKQGRSLQELAAELERQVNTRKDYIAPQGAIEAKVIDGEVVLDGLNGETVGIQPTAHKQFADHLGIPSRYYERMKTEQPDLLASNLNTWLHDKANEKRMVRTLDGKARAFLSPKFRALDNFELANAVLPALIQNKVEVLSSELTEKRLYIKGILPTLSDKLPDGMQWGEGHNRVDGLIVAAVTISNSEIGMGTLLIEPSVYTPWCTNLAALVKSAIRKYHVGRSVSAEDYGYEIFRDETRRADDTAFWMKVRDVTVAAFDKDAFRAAIESIKHTTSVPITSTDLPKVVDVTVRRLALPEATANSILTHLAKGGDLTQWGLASAITRTANDAETYELATDLEHAGGEVLALTGNDWKVVAEAA